MEWRRRIVWAFLRRRQIAAVAAFVGACAPTLDAHACSSSQNEVYRSQKTAWCVEKTLVAKSGAFPSAYFSYGDNVVDMLVALFRVPAEGIYTFEAAVPSGSAHTGSECCGLGVTVTGDAFYNTGYGVKGFWGYLLTLHEMVNDFTGQVTSGWPTDFWADHVSAFPNSMDWRIMAELAKKNGDANLLKASESQKARFYPGGDSVDARVGMFDKIFDLPNYGFDGLSRMFAMYKSDKLSLDGLGVNNPDPKRTEYVIAYLSLAAGRRVTPIMTAAHVGDGTPSGAGDAGYVVSDQHIDAIASAHCAIVSAGAQGKNVTADASAFRSGKYTNVKALGACGAGCQGECGCKASASTCVPQWLADAPVEGKPDAGSDSGAGSIGGTGPADGGKPGSLPPTNAGADAGRGTGAANPGDSPSVSDGNGAGGCTVGRSNEERRLVSFFAISAFAGLSVFRLRSRRRRSG